MRTVTVEASKSEFLTAAHVRARYGVGRMWIERRIKQSGFPKPLKFGGVSAVRFWRRSDIEAWEAKWQPRDVAPVKRSAAS